MAVVPASSNNALGSDNSLLAHECNVYQELQHMPCLHLSMVQVELSECAEVYEKITNCLGCCPKP